MPGSLFVVATPIGNLDDITHRAIQTLRSVDLIVCEDTRRTAILLDHLSIQKPMRSFPAFAEAQRSHAIIEILDGGQNVALVTDAGTPAISDPGERLVAEAVQHGIRVVPIPGAAALTTALSAAGLPTGRFHFLGFLPRGASERTAMLEEVALLSATLVFYESPRRLLETLIDLRTVLGDRRACVARELTKVHEEFARDTLTALHAHFAKAEVLGEVVVMVEGATGERRLTEAEMVAALQEGFSAGEKLKPLSKELATKSGWAANDIYRLGLGLKSRSGQ